MLIIVGLGNIGSKYDNTRHNIGFSVIDTLSKEIQIPLTENPQVYSIIGESNINGTKVILAKPTTFMNKSGLAVQRLLNKYKREPKNLIIVHDDITLPLGTLRWRSDGSAGGNNGLKSIIEAIGDKFWRLKIGVDTPPVHIETSDWVLSKFSKDELDLLNKVVKASSLQIIHNLEQELSETTIHIN
jgi:PTH1 family peptidyl-tRNA hydrolase